MKQELINKIENGQAITLDDVERCTDINRTIFLTGEPLLNYFISNKTMTYEGKREIIELLIRKKVKLIPSYGAVNTALSSAVIAGELRILEMLLTTKAIDTINYKDPVYNNSLLHLAAKHNHLEILKLLLSTKAIDDLNHPNFHGNTPLHLAAESANLELVMELLKYRDKLTVSQNSLGYNQFHLATKNPDLRVLEFFLDFSHTHTSNKLGNYVIHLAIKENNLDAVKLILNNEDAKKRINTLDKLGFMPIHYAAKYASKEITQLILSQKELTTSMAKTADQHKLSPLHLAAANGKLGNMECFIALGADVNEIVDSKHSPLSCVVDFFNNNCCNSYGCVLGPLEGAKEFNKELIHALINAGADINLVIGGETILHRVVQNTNRNRDNKILLKFLMESFYNIDYSITNYEGKTVAECAEYLPTRIMIEDAARLASIILDIARPIKDAELRKVTLPDIRRTTARKCLSMVTNSSTEREVYIGEAMANAGAGSGAGAGDDGASIWSKDARYVYARPSGASTTATAATAARVESSVARESRSIERRDSMDSTIFPPLTSAGGIALAFSTAGAGAGGTKTITSRASQVNHSIFGRMAGRLMSASASTYQENKGIKQTYKK